MEIAGCACTGAGIGNSGYPSGVKPFGVTAGIYKVPILAGDGSRNGLSLSSTTLGADILAMINNPDPTKRAYPFQDLKSVTPAEEDAVFVTDDRGVRSWLRNGIQMITYSVWGVSEQYYANVNSICVDFGIYEIDNCGNLKGQKEGEYLYPRPMNTQSFNSKFLPQTNEAKSQVVFNVDYDVNTSNGDQWMLPASDFTFNLLQLKGMIDVAITLVDVVSATSFIVDCEFNYGYANAPLPWTGAVLADFDLYNVTDSAVITPSAVAESATIPGRYTFTVPAVDATDEVTVNAFKAATGNLLNGFEGIELEFIYSWT